MNKPTKGQLAAAVVHYEASLNALLEDFSPAGESADLLDAIKAVVESAPSLEPVVKTYKEAIIEELGESALTGVYDNVVDPEAPATE
jgi:hypothetical protein